MLDLNSNLYNKAVQKQLPKLKIWANIGFLITYKCPAKCACCYYNCSPQKNGLLQIGPALAAWKDLKTMAGSRAKIHITGGEPFLYYEHLQKFLEQAQKQKLGKIDTLETNGFWADNKGIIKERLDFLNSKNVEKIKISCDPFHQEFIDIKKIRLLYETACQLWGNERAAVRWQQYLAENQQPQTEEQKMAAFVQSHKKFKCRIAGRAAGAFAQVLADKEISQIEQENCKKTLLSAKSVHIDPYGNVFSGTCSGIIIGNITKTPLITIWKNFNPAKMDFVSVLFHKGPGGLLQKAVEEGYEKRRLYASKCHLCTDLRQFFFDRGLFEQIIGPSDCYD